MSSSYPKNQPAADLAVSPSKFAASYLICLLLTIHLSAMTSIPGTPYPRCYVDDWLSFDDDSDDEFVSAEEFLTPASRASSEWAGFSPGTQENPIIIPSAPP